MLTSAPFRVYCTPAGVIELVLKSGDDDDEEDEEESAPPVPVPVPDDEPDEEASDWELPSAEPLVCVPISWLWQFRTCTEPNDVPTHSWMFVV